MSRGKIGSWGNQGNAEAVSCLGKVLIEKEVYEIEFIYIDKALVGKLEVRDDR